MVKEQEFASLFLESFLFPWIREEEGDWKRGRKNMLYLFCMVVDQICPEG